MEKEDDEHVARNLDDSWEPFEETMYKFDGPVRSSRSLYDTKKEKLNRDPKERQVVRSRRSLYDTRKPDLAVVDEKLEVLEELEEEEEGGMMERGPSGN